MNRHKLSGATALLATLAIPTQSLALSDSTHLGDRWKGWNIGQPNANEEGIDANFGWLFPSITASVTHDDNRYNTSDNKESITTVNIDPRLGLDFDLSAGSSSVISILGEVNIQYDFFDEKDFFIGYGLVADARFQPTEKSTVWGGLGWEHSQDGFGEGLLSSDLGPLVSEDPLEYDVYSARVGASYGAQEARAPQINFEAALEKKEYDSDLSELVKSRDNLAFRAGGSILYWVQPNTAMTGSLRYFDYDYEDDETSLISDADGPISNDSKQWRAMLGVQWDATAQTQGYAQIGWSRKDMRDARIEDSDGLNWEVGVKYKPLTYSDFVFSASRDFVEEDYNGYGDRREYRATWRHSWTTYLSTSLIYNIGTQTYPQLLDGQGTPQGVAREDDFWDVELSASYRARYWLTFEGSFRHSDRDSNSDLFTYDENVISLSVSATFD